MNDFSQVSMSKGSRATRLLSLLTLLLPLLLARLLLATLSLSLLLWSSSLVISVTVDAIQSLLNCLKNKKIQFNL